MVTAVDGGCKYARRYVHSLPKFRRVTLYGITVLTDTLTELSKRRQLPIQKMENP
jgi:hypothetical protein